MADPSMKAVQKVLDYIDEHITEKLTGEELAGQAAFFALSLLQVVCPTDGNFRDDLCNPA